MRIPGRLLLPPILLLVVLMVALACGDDDDVPPPGSPTIRTSPSATVSATPAPDEKETPEPTEDAGEATPGSDQTPPPTAEEGTPAVAPDDQNAFLSRFQGRPVSEEACIYSPATRVTDCGARGKFAVDPPLAGQDVTCAILILGEEPAAIRCTSQEPLQTLYYEIQE